METSKYKDSQNQREILEMMGQISNKSKLQESVQAPLRAGRSEDRRPAASARKKVPAGASLGLKLSTVETQTIDSAEDHLAAEARFKAKPLPARRQLEASPARTDFEEPSSPALLEGDSGLAELQSPQKRPAKKKTLIRAKKATPAPRTFETFED